MPTRIRPCLSRFALPVLAAGAIAGPIAVGACSSSALAQTMEGSGSSSVLMFDRPPTVDELREVVAPKPRTRSIEIMGGAASGAAQRPRPAEQASYPPEPESAPAPAKAASRPAKASQPAPRPAVSQPANPDRQAAPPDARQQAALPAPEPVPEPEPAAPNAFGFRINFAFNSAEIPRDFQPYVDAVGGLMAQDRSLVLVVEGHTDAVGSPGYNQTLSQRRAVAVGEYLVRVHHIDPQRIAVAGKGPSEPVMPDPYDGRNRRVEFKPAR